jgi:hypothetical protein
MHKAGDLFPSRITYPESHTFSPSYENLRIRIISRCSRILYPIKVKLCLNLLKRHVMKAYGRVGIYIHVFLTSELDGGAWQLHAPATLPPRKQPPRCPLDRTMDRPECRSGSCGEEINLLSLPRFAPRFLGQQERSAFLYRLNNLGSPL